MPDSPLQAYETEESQSGTAHRDCDVRGLRCGLRRGDAVGRSMSRLKRKSPEHLPARPELETSRSAVWVRRPQNLKSSMLLRMAGWQIQPYLLRNFLGPLIVPTVANVLFCHRPSPHVGNVPFPCVARGQRRTRRRGQRVAGNELFSKSAFSRRTLRSTPARLPFWWCV